MNARDVMSKPVVWARSGRIRSPSLTIPIGVPLSSTTGTALIPLSSSSRATSRKGASGYTGRQDGDRVAAIR